MANVPGQSQQKQMSVPGQNKQNQGPSSVVYHDQKLIPREARKIGEVKQSTQILQKKVESNLKAPKKSQNPAENFHIQPENYKKQQEAAVIDIKNRSIPQNQIFPSPEVKNQDEQKRNLSPKMQHEGELLRKQEEAQPNQAYQSRNSPMPINEMATQRTNLSENSPAPINDPLPKTQTRNSPKMQGENLIYPQKNKRAHTRYTDGQLYGWNNKYGIEIPIINFDKDCKKCHGTGSLKRRFHSGTIPCTQCYSKAGYCTKCYGTGTNFTKNTPCLRWHGCGGEKMARKSSPQKNSSDQEEGN